MARIGPRPTAFEAFKTLRNRLSKVRAQEVIREILEALNHPQAGSWDRIKYFRPWELLLLLKWTLLYGELRPALARSLKQAEWNTIVNLTAEVFNCARLPSEYDDPHLFFRNVAYQQFWFQHELSGAGIARQSIMLAGLPENHAYRRTFREKVGIEIPEFIELAVMLLPKIQQPAPGFTSAWFAPVASRYAPGTIDKFLRAISAEVMTAKQFIAARRPKDINWEVYERTPFQSIPVLRVNANFMPISRVLLYRTLELFVYRFLRDSDPERFMQGFGPLFERYVFRVLNFAEKPYWNEKQIRAVCPGDKVVDVFLRDGDDNVLMDAKGVELPEIGMITHLPQVVRDRSKPSILKAVDQAYSTMRCLRQAIHTSKPYLGPGKNFLVVVTALDTYLGNGVDFFRMVGEEELTKIQQRYGGEPLIPADQMYFVAVEDLEILCGLVKEGKTQFSAALRKAQADDATGTTKKFVFHQHLLDAHGEPDLLDFLDAEIDAIFERCREKFIGPAPAPGS